MASVGESIVRFLVDHGIRYVFGVPGGENVEFMEEARRQGLEYVLASREGTAAYMADAYGQLTGRPGVCLSTVAPGSTSIVNGVANALLDRSPMLAITAQQPTRRAAYFTHENVDQLRLFAPVTKWSVAIAPGAVHRTLAKAARIAVAPRPGPVHLDLPGDVVAMPAGDQPVPVQWNPTIPTAVGPLEEAARRLRHSRRPVVVAGLAAARAGERGQAALTRLAEAWQMPVVVTGKAKGVIAETHPFFAGVLDMAAHQVVAGLLEQADLLVAVGFDPVELIRDWRLQVPVVHVDELSNTDQVYASVAEVTGDIPLALEQLAQAASSAEPRWEAAEVAEVRRALWRRLVEQSTSRGLAPHQVVLEAQEAFGDDALVTIDVGSHKLLVNQLWRTAAPRRVFQSNGLSTMGFGFPAALAISLALDRQRVLCMTGDGGFLMVLGDLWVAVSRRLPVTTVVFCDGSLNRILLKQEDKGYPPVGTLLDNPDFARVAEAFGAAGFTARTREELRQALAAARQLEGPAVIAAHVDPAEYKVQF